MIFHRRNCGKIFVKLIHFRRYPPGKLPIKHLMFGNHHGCLHESVISGHRYPGIGIGEYINSRVVHSIDNLGRAIGQTIINDNRFSIGKALILNRP